MAYKVFLSHSFQDKDLVDALENSLRGIGIDPYMAEFDPNFGGLLPRKIEEQIDSSQAVLVILTKKANLSPSVNQEIGYAKKGGKLIVALVEVGVVTGVLLQAMEVVKFSADKLDDAIERINAFFKKLEKDDSSKKDWLVVIGLASVLVVVFIAGYVVGKARRV